MAAYRVIPLFALLAGCAGTQLSMTGQICGQDLQMSLVDRKDRSGFEGSIDCPGGGGVHVASTESSTSAVLVAQTQLLQTLAGLVAQLAHAAPVPPASYGLPPRRDGVADAALARQVRGTVP